MDNAGRDNCAFDVMVMITVLIWSMALEKECDEAGDGGYKWIWIMMVLTLFLYTLTELSNII